MNKIFEKYLWRSSFTSEFFYKFFFKYIGIFNRKAFLRNISQRLLLKDAENLNFSYLCFFPLLLNNLNIVIEIYILACAVLIFELYNNFKDLFKQMHWVRIYDFLFLCLGLKSGKHSQAKQRHMQNRAKYLRWSFCENN